MSQADLARQLGQLVAASRLPGAFELGLPPSRALQELVGQAGANNTRSLRPQSSIVANPTPSAVRLEPPRSASFLEQAYLNQQQQQQGQQEQYQNEQPIFSANHRATIIDTSSDSSQRTSEMLLSPRLLHSRKLNGSANDDDDSYCN